MDDKSFTIRLPKRWARIAMIVGVTALVVAPLSAAAVHSFDDVPNDNTFHDDIEAIKNADVTRGCNPPANTLYCPDDFVTREQMAAFMNRLGALGPGQTPVANAATAVEADDSGMLEGFSAAQLAPRAAFAFSNSLPNEDTTLDTTIEAPAPGILVMNATVDITAELATSALNTIVCRLRVDGANVPGTGMFARVGGDVHENICSTTGAIAVGSGSHDVTFGITSVGSSRLFHGSLNVIWVPFDGTGVTPSEFTVLGGEEVTEKTTD